jgi:hypothetical protein
VDGHDGGRSRAGSESGTRPIRWRCDCDLIAADADARAHEPCDLLHVFFCAQATTSDRLRPRSRGDRDVRSGVAGRARPVAPWVDICCASPSPQRLGILFSPLHWPMFVCCPSCRLFGPPFLFSFSASVVADHVQLSFSLSFACTRTSWPRAAQYFSFYSILLSCGHRIELLLIVSQKCSKGHLGIEINKLLFSNKQCSSQTLMAISVI